MRSTGYAEFCLAAHRGAMARAAENSLESFVLAERSGADELELDVRVTADGIPIVIHDATLGRVAAHPSPVTDVPVDQLSLAEVQAVILLSGAPVPTLAQVLDATRAPLQVEIKDLAAVAGVAHLLAMDPEAAFRIRFTSFLPDALFLLQLHLPAIPRGLIIPAFPAATDDVRNLYDVLFLTGSAFLNCGLGGLTAAAVDRLHVEDFLVNVWPLTSPHDLIRAVELGADGGTCDDPLAAWQWRNLYWRHAGLTVYGRGVLGEDLVGILAGEL
ncbi:MAG: glycerophosphodiester phosphodiesterase [Micrococcaceae bacterium]|nr:glycerophosphodiester phosphodiesterase [Micrococcaceae bacterium]